MRERDAVLRSRREAEEPVEAEDKAAIRHLTDMLRGQQAYFQARAGQVQDEREAAISEKKQGIASSESGVACVF